MISGWSKSHILDGKCWYHDLKSPIVKAVEFEREENDPTHEFKRSHRIPNDKIVKSYQECSQSHISQLGPKS